LAGVGTIGRAFYGVARAAALQGKCPTGQLLPLHIGCSAADTSTHTSDMAMDIAYFERRVRSLENAIDRLQQDVGDTHRIANDIVREYQQWAREEHPGKEWFFRRLDELVQRGSPRCVFAKTLVLEYGVSRSKAYQLVREYLDNAAASQTAA
jgi:hypothetical protein